MYKLELKYVRETPFEHSHTEVHFKGTLLGYYMRNNSPYSKAGQNFNFVSKSEKVKSFGVRTKKELLEILINQLNK